MWPQHSALKELDLWAALLRSRVESVIETAELAFSFCHEACSRVGFPVSGPRTPRKGIWACSNLELVLVGLQEQLPRSTGRSGTRFPRLQLQLFLTRMEWSRWRSKLSAVQAWQHGVCRQRRRLARPHKLPSRHSFLQRQEEGSEATGPKQLSKADVYESNVEFVGDCFECDGSRSYPIVLKARLRCSFEGTVHLPTGLG